MNKRPIVPMVKGTASAVVQDAEAYLRPMAIAESSAARKCIRLGLQEAKAGEGRDIEDFFDEFEAAHGISD